jgi:hypothetical protein
MSGMNRRITYIVEFKPDRRCAWSFDTFEDAFLFAKAEIDRVNSLIINGQVFLKSYNIDAELVHTYFQIQIGEVPVSEVHITEHWQYPYDKR